MTIACKTRNIGNYEVRIHHLKCPNLTLPVTDFKRKFKVIVELKYVTKELSQLGLSNVSLISVQSFSERNAIQKAIRAIRNQRFVQAVHTQNYEYQRYFLNRKIRFHIQLRDSHLHADDPTLSSNVKYVNHNNSKIACFNSYLDTLKDL